MENTISVGNENWVKGIKVSPETHRALVLAKARFNFKTASSVIDWLLKEKGLMTEEPANPVNPHKMKGNQIMRFKETPLVKIVKIVPGEPL